MGECVVCGRGTSVSAGCPHCAYQVCGDHRDPDAHDCPGVDADRTTGWRIDLDAASVAERERWRATRDDGGGGDGGDDDPVLALFADRGRGLALATFVLLAVVVAAGALVGGADTGAGLNETQVERLVAAEVNEERRAAGLEPLAYDPDLAAVAAFHSRDMYERGYFAHVGPDGETLADRYDRFGLDCPGGENIYATPSGGLATGERALAEHVVREWMDSPGHRENVLKERYTRQGIGIVVASGTVYATQDFC